MLTDREKKLRGVYSVRNLLKTHSEDDCGPWVIVGESDSTGMGGSRGKELAVLEMPLSEAITAAADMPGFWSWGGGGELYKMEREPRFLIEARYYRDKYEQAQRQLEEINK